MIININTTEKDNIISLRRDLHRIPEKAFCEHNTSEYIAKQLMQMGIETQTAIGKTGVVGLIRGKNPGKTLAIRADIDALEINEQTNLDFVSTHKGFMHACGHDAHIACLLGAAKALNSIKNELCGNVKLVFQPAEEILKGASAMLEDKVFDNPEVDACIGFHVWPGIPSGSVEVNFGATMSGSANLTIEIEGKGGHGAMPHMAVNPLTIAARVATALQDITSSSVSSLSPAVLTLCELHTGTAHNIIPQTAKIRGTIRTLNEKVEQQIIEDIHRITSGIATAFKGTAKITVEKLVPPVINDEIMTQSFINFAKTLLGSACVLISKEPSMGSDDFAYFAKKVPSVYFRLGCKNTENNIEKSWHSPQFDIDENCLPTGTALLATFAIDYLNN